MTLNCMLNGVYEAVISKSASS